MRVHTERLLEMIENNQLDPTDVVKMCVKYMSEDDVEDMIDTNELSERFEPEDDYDDSMDGDHESALASAGWGTDEDYGCFGGDEY